MRHCMCQCKVESASHLQQHNACSAVPGLIDAFVSCASLLLAGRRRPGRCTGKLKLQQTREYGCVGVEGKMALSSSFAQSCSVEATCFMRTTGVAGFAVHDFTETLSRRLLSKQSQLCAVSAVCLCCVEMTGPSRCTVCGGLIIINPKRLQKSKMQCKPACQAMRPGAPLLLLA